MLWLCSVSEEAMTDLVQKIREALAKITPWCSCQGRATCIGCLIETITKEHHGQSGVDFLLDHIEAGQWLSQAADEIERLTHLHNLDHSLADQWQKKNVGLEATIATLRDRLTFTNAAIRQEILRLDDKPFTQAFLAPFVELNEKALATTQEDKANDV